MPACHQATDYRPRSPAISAAPCSNMTQNLGAWRVGGSLVVVGVVDMK